MSTHIYHGAWTNWSRGRISGATITLGERDGGLLTAFIATFVTIVGAELWKIVCFVSHQLRSNSEPQDGLYHQQQFILRNAPTPGGAVWSFFQQSWFWSGKVRQSHFRTLSWAFFGIAYIGIIGVVAIFSSEISKSPGSLRLLIGQCGLWNIDTSVDAAAALNSRITNDTLLAASYASACYGGSFDPLRCGKYRVPSLQWQINRNVTCPFPENICSYESTAAAVNMTTKLLDSQNDLGINAKSKDRVQVQKSSVCAPLKRTEYSTVVEGTNQTTEFGTVGDDIIFYNYGSWYHDDGSLLDNYTWVYNTHTRFDATGYSVKSISSQVGPTSVWAPIAALNATDADLSMMLVSGNSIRYSNPVNDPIFAAHGPAIANALINKTVYTSDAAGGVIGCSEQYRICNPVNNKCTPFAGASQQIDNISPDMDFNLQQLSTTLRITAWFARSDASTVTSTRSGSSLRANEIVDGLFSPGLPSNQWQIEVSAWFDVSLSIIQAGVQSMAANTANIVPGSTFQTFNSTDGPFYDFCSSQLVNDSTGTISFSVLGLVILFMLGALVIITALTLDVIVGYIQMVKGKGLHARMEWLVGDKLQTHMMLMRAHNLGQWTNGDIQLIPTTVGGEQKFYGPAQNELRAQHLVGDSDGEADIQLVQHESDPHEAKRWN